MPDIKNGASFPRSPKKEVEVILEDMGKTRKKGRERINYFNKRHVSHTLTDRTAKGEDSQSPK